MKNKVPCYECQDRHISCHDTCEIYLTWQKEHIERKRQEKAERLNNSRVTDFTIKQIEKRKRK